MLRSSVFNVSGVYSFVDRIPVGASPTGNKEKVSTRNERKRTMKYAIAIAASSSVACLVGCASTQHIAVSEAVGPAPTEIAETSGKSVLQVYSARVKAPIDPNREEFLWNNDFGKNDFLYEPAHTDYTICTEDGKVLQRVRNARGPQDAEPTAVPLPPGRYLVKAEARDFGLVTIPVVIEPGKPTVVNLQRYRKPVSESAAKTDLVWLGDRRIVGWRAKSSSPLDRQ
jgi:hypothetical protein